MKLSSIKIKKISGKKASGDWTVGKLLTIILLVLVLVLVVYGVVTGALNPLITKIAGYFNEAMYYFNIKTPAKMEFTKDVNINDVGKGKFSLDPNTMTCMVTMDSQVLDNFAAKGFKLDFTTLHLMSQVGNSSLWEDREFFLQQNNNLLVYSQLVSIVNEAVFGSKNPSVIDFDKISTTFQNTPDFTNKIASKTVSINGKNEPVEVSETTLMTGLTVPLLYVSPQNKQYAIDYYSPVFEFRQWSVQNQRWELVTKIDNMQPVGSWASDISKMKKIKDFLLEECR